MSTNAIGMPQLEFINYPSQIFWTIVLFFALYYVVSFFIKKVSIVRDTREKIIKELIDEAKSHKQEIAAIQNKIDEKLAIVDAKAGSIISNAYLEIKNYRKQRYKELYHYMENIEEEFSMFKKDFWNSNATEFHQCVKGIVSIMYSKLGYKSGVNEKKLTTCTKLIEQKVIWGFK